MACRFAIHSALHYNLPVLLTSNTPGGSLRDLNVRYQAEYDASAHAIAELE